jgi:hypothetical protein
LPRRLIAARRAAEEPVETGTLPESEKIEPNVIIEDDVADPRWKESGGE